MSSLKQQRLLIGVALIWLTGCGQHDPTSASAGVEAETARLNAWFEQRFEEQLDFSPMQKTNLGRKDDYDQIDDLSEAAEDRRWAWHRRTVEDLQASFAYERLTPEAQTSWDLWVYQLQRAEQALPFRRRAYVLTQMNGRQATLPRFLINMHKVDEAADMEAYIARIAAISRAIGQLLERAQLAAAEGVRPPRFAYEGVIRESRALLTGAPFDGAGDSPLWLDARAKIAALRAAGKIDAAQAGELEAATRAALTQHLQPAYARLIDWFDDDMANAGEIAAGIWHLPEGEAVYALRLAQATTTDLTPAEVHEYGLAEVARIHAEMTAIKRQVGFDGSLQQFFVFMREDPRFFFPNTDAGREAYLQTARERIAAISERLPEFFGILPRAGLEVRRVEAFREQAGGAAHYSRGSPDGSRPAVYYSHLADMNALPKHRLEAVAYHEGNPGHHMQIAIAQELTTVPTFRTQLGFTAFSEGWALYAELLAKEMGAYEDPYADFGRLSAELWRAIRLVLDTGLHAQRWTQEQAIAYALENSPNTDSVIRSEVRRFMAWPAQATSYKIGMRKILELREAARDELGAAFDIRGFHDTVLGGGALPLPMLERRVAAWVAAQRVDPATAAARRAAKEEAG
ncbi:MAG: DUF885 domain-containing protein [Pseudomonadales bacterium]